MPVSGVPIFVNLNSASFNWLSLIIECEHSLISLNRQFCTSVKKTKGAIGFVNP